MLPTYQAQVHLTQASSYCYDVAEATRAQQSPGKAFFTTTTTPRQCTAGTTVFQHEVGPVTE
jgi:hypothetical protein